MRFRGLVWCLVGAFALPVVAAAQDGFAPIFDGKTLDGWDGDPDHWKVEDGCITGVNTAENPAKGNTFCIWRGGDVGDFEISLDYKLVGNNSGIQYRSVENKTKWSVSGYQADMEAGDTYSGILYGEGFGGILANRGQKTVVRKGPDGKEVVEVVGSVGDSKEIQSKIKKDDWNSYHVIARGFTFEHRINGVTTAICTDERPEHRAKGILALQLHAGPPMKVQFRNIRLKATEAGATQAARKKKVLLLAGNPSHGFGSHDHLAGCSLLARRLNESGLPIEAEVHSLAKQGWPSAEKLEAADTIVVYADGGGGHPFNAHLAELDKLFAKGKGVVCIHYGVEVPKGPPGDAFLRWTGGYFETNWSVNPHWTADYTKFPDHPITRGVKPFKINDEWYYHMRFRDNLEGVTPILTDLPPKQTVGGDGSHSGNPAVREAIAKGEPQHMAWATERPGGGRGFGCSGGHVHWNWGQDQFRKLFLNAIAWTAGLDIPPTGVEAGVVTVDDLLKDHDEPIPANFDKARVQEQIDRSNGSDSCPPSISTGPARPGDRGKPTAVAGLWRPHAHPMMDASNVDTPRLQTGDFAMRRWPSLLLAVCLAFGSSAAGAADPKPIFDSKTVSSGTPGHGVNVDVDLQGARELWLVVTDAGDGFGCDWADWAEPRLVGPSGETKLTALKWKQATSGFGEVRVDANAGGALLKIDGKAVADGIGTHAPSVIGFDLPPGVTRFRARAGIDDGGTDQGCGSTVQFLVYTQKPPARLASVASAGGGTHELEKALEGLEVAPGLDAALFAGEPMLLSPADIDVDHKGRVWVCEVVNYRGRNGQRPEGDRILILEDTNQDGVADKQTVFYQGRDIDSALGICVLGKKVIVSVAPNVFVFTDEDGDGKADKKEVLFTKVGQPQHDHSTHAFIFGPDGKLYWNIGNAGQAVHDRNGKPIIDRAGNVVNDAGKPYRQGMVFRCNQDGSGFETLAHNFRNNYEVAVDSFGTLWQSDNDDDGNRGVRINYVMEFGNYGYTDEMTGAGWQAPRTNLETETPLRHWHQNDPGVVPNLLLTGGGSPTGICVYEGALLPEVFRNQIIHSDAGPNVVRAYSVKEQGAGYSAGIENILEGTRDKWFRPSDVCVAPDGSLIVADWYDPGVGGHAMGDVDKGRIFRIAPPGAKYVSPTVDVSTIDGAINALRSPNQDARYLAWTALHDFGTQAEPALAKMFREDPNPRFRARALWLLSKLPGKDADYLKAAVTGGQDDLKVVAIRAGRELSPAWRWSPANVAAESPGVRRELAIALVEDSSPAAEWAKLAQTYRGDDRWFLEALGIAAAKHWDECLASYLKAVPDALSTQAGRDIIWRSRAAQTPGLLARLIENPATRLEELPRLFRAFDFQTGAGKRSAIEHLAFGATPTDSSRQKLIDSESVDRLEGGDVSRSPEKRAALEKLLERTRGTSAFVTLIDKFEVRDRYPDLIALATTRPDGPLAVDAVEVLLRRGQREILSATLGGSNVEAAASLARVLGSVRDRQAAQILAALLDDRKTPDALATEAARGMAKSPQGARDLLRRIRDKSLAPDLTQAVAFALQTTPFNDARLTREIEAVFPPPPARNDKPLPPLATMLRSKGDAARGKAVFQGVAKCNTCHVVDGDGKEVGPNLSEIGSKLSREGFFESILFPSAGISHNYETWSVSTVDGNVVSGIKVSETPSEIVLKGSDSIARNLKRAEIDEMKKQSISLMPADLQKTMTAQELIDVIEYLQTLKKR